MGPQRRVSSTYKQRKLRVCVETGEVRLVLRQLTRRLGNLPTSVKVQIQALSLLQLKALGEALLGFAQLSNLTDWLQSNS